MATDDALIEDLAGALYESYAKPIWTRWEELPPRYKDEDKARVRAILRALQNHPRWRVVPVDHDQAMYDAAWKEHVAGGSLDDIYAAMLAAAPKPVES